MSHTSMAQAKEDVVAYATYSRISETGATGKIIDPDLQISQAEDDDFDIFSVIDSWLSCSSDIG